MDVWDVRLAAGKSARFPIASGRNSMLVALRGTLLVNGESVARDAQLALFSRDGEDITVEANNDAVFLVLSGEPIDEPVVGYGPFVMNTQAEIVRPSPISGRRPRGAHAPLMGRRCGPAKPRAAPVTAFLQWSAMPDLQPLLLARIRINPDTVLPGYPVPRCRPACAALRCRLPWP